MAVCRDSPKFEEEHLVRLARYVIDPEAVAGYKKLKNGVLPISLFDDSII